MNGLIKEWKYHQKKGLLWKGWAEEILDGRPVQGIPPWQDAELSQWEENEFPTYPIMPKDVLIPPVVLASSVSDQEVSTAEPL